MVSRFDKNARCKLTLLSALAGFGKTVAMIHWIQSTLTDQTNEVLYEVCDSGISGEVMPISRVAWLFIERSDIDPERFLSYFIAALAAIDQFETEIRAERQMDGI